MAQGSENPLSLQASAVIALLDIDSFECQVWQRMFPEYRGKPCVVADMGGRIVSVTYEAKDYGVNREMRVPEALRICQASNVQLQIFQKPNVREKPETRTLRMCSWEVLDCLKELKEVYFPTMVLEYASNDEFYLDLTEEVNRLIKTPFWNCNITFGPRTYLEGKQTKFSTTGLKYRVDSIYPKDSQQYFTEERLVCGASIVQNICKYLLRDTKFESSCGVGTNKLMAKLGCSFNKPRSITVLPHSSLPRVSQIIKLCDIPGFKGKSGENIKTRLGINFMCDLEGIDYTKLENLYPNDTEFAWKLFQKSYGICDEKVVMKLMYDEVSCGKSFPEHKNVIGRESDLYHHVHNLAEELVERLEEEKVRHKRVTSTVKVTITYRGRISCPSGEKLNVAFTLNVNPNQSEKISTIAYNSILNHSTFDVLNAKVTKICLTAKNFASVKL